MIVAVTGGTGFVGIELIGQLIENGHTVRAWHRQDSDRSPLSKYKTQIQWVQGQLSRGDSEELLTGCDALVHAAVWRDQASFQAPPRDLVEYARVNILGSLELMQRAFENRQRMIFVSTCAVHDVILDDRPLDEAHPLWPKSHYGAHKAALEKFVHSYGLGQGMPICALRPTGIYGIAHPVQHSKWYDLIVDAAAGRPVVCSKGGKEVHVADVARAIQVLLSADKEQIAGRSFSCYDRYISEYDVAHLTQQVTGQRGEIIGEPIQPKNQIATSSIHQLGMQFGGADRLRETIESMLAAIDA